MVVVWVRDWLARHCLVSSRCRQHLPDPCLLGSHHPESYSSASTVSRAELGVQGTARAVVARLLCYVHLCTPGCLTQEVGLCFLHSRPTVLTQCTHLCPTWSFSVDLATGRLWAVLTPPWFLYKELLSTCGPGEPVGSACCVHLPPSSPFQDPAPLIIMPPPPPPPALWQEEQTGRPHTELVVYKSLPGSSVCLSTYISVSLSKGKGGLSCKNPKYNSMNTCVLVSLSVAVKPRGAVAHRARPSVLAGG